GRHAWLPPLLFGFSSLAVLSHRLILLEAQQMFWLSLAAACWLSCRRGMALAAGGAFGMALLVKSNSIYLLPVFLLTLPSRQAAIGLLAGTLALAGGGYLAAWLGWPAEFTDAFRYELDGSRFADAGVLFRFGRFGLHPERLSNVLTDLLFTDLGLVLLGLV